MGRAGSGPLWLVWLTLALTACGTHQPTTRPTWSTSELAAQRRCEAGDVGGCGDLGRSLVRGARDIRDIQRGLVLLEGACGQGQMPACATLGDWYRVQDDDKAHTRAIELSTRACDRRVAEGCRVLGEVYLYDDRQSPRAAAMFQTACDLGDAEGCEKQALFVARTTGDRGGQELPYQRACALGRPPSCHLLGMLRMHDPATRADGLAMLARNCAAGHDASCLPAASAFAPVIGGQPDCAAAAPLAGRACLARMDDGCAIHDACEVRAGHAPADALSRLRAACDHGISLACFYWAEAQARPGTGDAGALGQAYVAACRGRSAGADAACARLALIMLERATNSEESERPLSILRQQCEQSVPAACCALADAYTNGRVVAADPEQASRFRERTCPSCCDRL